MKGFLIAIQFLTIIPVPSALFSYVCGYGYDDARYSDADVGVSSAYFPLVGCFIGLLLAALAFTLEVFFPIQLTAVLVLAAKALITGGLHLDGLSDTVDAISCRRDRAAKLQIMKGGAAGPAGVTALVLILLMQYICIQQVVTHSMLMIVLAPVIGRYAAVFALYIGKSAKNSGLGRTFIENTNRREFLIATFFTIIISIVVSVFSANLIIFLITYIFVIAAVKTFQMQFGGLTGDSIGTIIECTETLVLLITVLLVHQ
ncbi:MAG: adenosylcobinamide-GDP ribazoletransferase [Candidatus Magnetoovum sp. WYHC-5]|nr:adenosylcobinamide-GDP ribazoletransferase [Candidatus Magnetoovum sp. WYHC-5]